MPEEKPAAGAAAAAPAQSQQTDQQQANGKTDAGAGGGKPTIYVKVYAPFHVYFEGEAYSISAVNETGPFDILPHHHNFLCMLVPCELVIKTPAGERKVKITRAIMHVKAEKVSVFVDV